MRLTDPFEGDLQAVREVGLDRWVRAARRCEDLGVERGPDSVQREIIHVGSGIHSEAIDNLAGTSSIRILLASLPSGVIH